LFFCDRPPVGGVTLDLLLGDRSGSLAFDPLLGGLAGGYAT